MTIKYVYGVAPYKGDRFQVTLIPIVNDFRGQLPAPHRIADFADRAAAERYANDSAAADRRSGLVAYVG